MPVGYSSPSRNFFLLGAVGGDVVTNFFKGVDRSLDTFNSFRLKQLNYDGSIGSVQSYILGGNKYDGTSYAVADTHGWFEKRTFNSETLATATAYEVTVSSSIDDNVEINDIKLDSSGNTYIAGRADSSCFVGKYDSSGNVVWNSTSFTGDAIFYGLALDSSSNLYACGQTENSDEDAIVQRFDNDGTVSWGKTISTTNGIVKLQRCAINSRGHLVAVGYIEDATHEGEFQTKFKGYIIKLDVASGDILWTRTLEDRYYYSSIGLPESIICEDITIDNDDDMYVVGRMLWDGAKYHSFLVKYTPEGNIVWQTQTPRDNTHRVKHFAVKTDSDTKQTVVFGDYYNTSTADSSALLSKYDQAGNLLWRRKITSSEQGSSWIYDTRLDADSTFYYMAFTDDNTNLTTGNPDRYVFGKVSTSGNGLGSFQYDDGTGRTIDYTILTVGDTPAKLWDGSVRQDTTDFITYPYSANKLLFDDLATQISNKKAQIAEAGTYQEAGSPAIRVSDFNQAINLRGDIYSGSGDWLDQSGNNKNGVINSATYNTGGYFEFTGPTSSSTRIAVDTSGYGNQDFSISMWFNQDDQTTYHMLLGAKGYGQGTESGIGHYLYQDTIKTWVQEGSGSAVNIWDSNGVVNFTAGVWYNLVLMREYGVAWRWYVNGTLVNTNTTQFLTTDWTSSESYIGDHYNTSVYHFDGSIGDVLIYDKALTAAQVFQNYNATKSKYINEAPDTAPKIGPGIVYDSNLLLNYDFGNRATFDKNVTNVRTPFSMVESTAIEITPPPQVSFGNNSMAIGYGRLVVGREYANSGNDEVYIYDYSGNLIDTIAGPNASSAFGSSVAIGSDRIVVGARFGDVPSSLEAGWIKIFDLSGNELRKVNNPDPAYQDHFGYSVAVGGNRIVVGAYGDDDNGSITGSAYIFDLSGNYITKLVPSEINAIDFFGIQVYIFEEKIAIVSLNTGDLQNASVWLYDLDGNFIRQFLIVDPERGDAADRVDDLVIYKDKLIVGDSGGGADYDGRVYVYDLDGNLLKTLSSDNDQRYPAGNLYYEFGNSVSADVDSNIIAIGAWYSENALGSVYFYDDDFNYIGKFTNPNPAPEEYDFYGEVVKVGDGKIVIKATHDNQVSGDAKFRIYSLTYPLPTTVKNLSSSSYTGTINGATFNSAGYFVFDGSNDDISVSSLPAFADAGAITIESWANADTITNTFQVIATAKATTTHWQLSFTGDPTYNILWAFAGTSDSVGTTTLPSTGAWHHITATYNGGDKTELASWKVYIDGTEATIQLTGSTGAATNDTFIGHRSGGPTGNRFDGNIGEVRIYNRALTAAEVSQNFNATRSKYGV